MKEYTPLWLVIWDACSNENLELQIVSLKPEGAYGKHGNHTGNTSK